MKQCVTINTMGVPSPKHLSPYRFFEVPILSLGLMVGVAQFGRALDCGSSGRGFKSHRSPHLQHHVTRKHHRGPLAQLVEQLTLNQRVVGSNPTRPTTTLPVKKLKNWQSLTLSGRKWRNR